MALQYNSYFAQYESLRFQSWLPEVELGPGNKRFDRHGMIQNRLHYTNVAFQW